MPPDPDEGNLPGYRKRPTPRESYTPVPRSTARMLITPSSGPAFWVDTHAWRDYGAPTPAHIEYLLVKIPQGPDFRVWEEQRFFVHREIIPGLPQSAVAIVGVRNNPDPVRLDHLDGLAIDTLAWYEIEHSTGAVLRGQIISDVTFMDYTDAAHPAFDVNNEVVRWSYDSSSVTEYDLPSQAAVLQADGRRVVEDEGVG